MLNRTLATSQPIQGITLIERYSPADIQPEKSISARYDSKMVKTTLFLEVIIKIQSIKILTIANLTIPVNN